MRDILWRRAWRGGKGKGMEGTNLSRSGTRLCSRRGSGVHPPCLGAVTTGARNNSPHTPYTQHSLPTLHPFAPPRHVRVHVRQVPGRPPPRVRAVRAAAGATCRAAAGQHARRQRHNARGPPGGGVAAQRADQGGGGADGQHAAELPVGVRHGGGGGAGGGEGAVARRGEGGGVRERAGWWYCRCEVGWGGVGAVMAGAGWERRGGETDRGVCPLSIAACSTAQAADVHCSCPCLGRRTRLETRLAPGEPDFLHTCPQVLLALPA